MYKLFICTLLALCIAAPAVIQAGYEEGYRAANKGAYATAFKEFKAAAEKGDVRAQYSLAVMYNDGIGTKKNPDEAMIWFRKAAAKGASLGTRDSQAEKQMKHIRIQDQEKEFGL